MPSFGDTISTGIQDISALLPLLGTEQCERHVGTALEKGFLYAAATPLSIFGSLGIVRTAFATLLGTITYPFYGAEWLDDAGFNTFGSVSSMITIAQGTKQYGAEVNLDRVMKDQNINDPMLVSDIDWSGWGERKSIPLSWNFQLIVTSALCAVISISPYLYLIHDHWNDPSSWIFPLLRSSGAFLCVVSVQLALQIRIHQITKVSLLLMKVKQRTPLADTEAMKEQDHVMEKRLSKLCAELDNKLKRSSDLENLLDIDRVEQDRDALTTCQSFRSWSSWSLLLLQILLAAGMAMMVVGYIGCFNLVSRSVVANGAYVWLGMETALSLLRIFLWGYNPTWDDLKTGLTISLDLHVPSNFDMVTSTAHPLQPLLNTIEAPQESHLHNPSPDTLFPLITTPHHLSRLSFSLRDLPIGRWRKDQKEGFIIETAENFLATATSYVGPLRRLPVENISLFYSIVPYVNAVGGQPRKFLCTTALHSGSNASISIFTGGNKTPHAVYSSYCDKISGTRTLQVTLQNEITDHPNSIDVLDMRTFSSIVEHSYNLFSQLLGGKTYSFLDLLWTVMFPSHMTENPPETMVPLTRFDKQYMRLSQTYDLKEDYCSRRGTHIIEVFSNPPAGSLRYGLLVEYGVVMESAILEIYLCYAEHQITQGWGMPQVMSRRLVLEWIRKMQIRIDVERRQCESRSSDLPTEVFETWDSLSLELRELRFPDNLAALQKWREPLNNLCTMEKDPNVSELFELRPLSKMRHLKNALSPIFQTQTQICRKMVVFLRPTLQVLHGLVHTQPDSPDSPSLFDRVDFPTRPADFSPPHVSVISKATKDGLSALTEQIHLTQTLQLRSVSSSGLQDWLDVLDCDSRPPTTLTTLNFRDIQGVFGRLDQDPVVRLILSILTKNHNIICLGFDNCRHVDDTILDHFQEAIKNNREEWVHRAQDSDKLVYLAGIQFSSGKEYNALLLTGHGAFSVFTNQDVFLTPVGEIFVLVSVPSRGKIVPVISLMLDDVDMYITAKLQRRTGQVDDEIPEVRTKASVASDGQRTLSLELDGFPYVNEGCYELRIWVRKRSYLFREVAVNFIPVTGENYDEV